MQTPLSFPVLERAARSLLPYAPESAMVSLTLDGSVRVEHSSFDGGWLVLTPDELVSAVLDDAESLVSEPLAEEPAVQD